MQKAKRDHGGGIDAAAARYGGARADWLDLSTGINPHPYPAQIRHSHSWTALPDSAAMTRLLDAARAFWSVPDAAQIVAAPGASSLIARMPYLASETGTAHVKQPTYNEHAAALQASGRWQLSDEGSNVALHVHVHPNNPDGRLCPADHPRGSVLTIIDESFCDVMPDLSLIAQTVKPGTVVLKSFGKFWGLAGLRLGFAIGTPATLAGLQDQLGPWAVSGPALDIGAQALGDHDWASRTRQRLAQDAARLDRIMVAAGAALVGGTTLFRLYHVEDASAWQQTLARHHIWTRIFPYNAHWLRLGLPDAGGWDRLEKALA